MPAGSMPLSLHSAWLLQRKLPSGDCAKWRTVLRFGLSQAPQVETFVKAARAIAPQVSWRVADEAGKSIDITEQLTGATP